MYYCLEIACVISEIWMIDWLLRGMFSLREFPHLIRPVLYSLYCIVLCVLSFIQDLSFLRIALNFGIISALGIILFQSNLIRSLFASLIICALAAFADVLISSALLHFGYHIEDLMQCGPERALYLITTHIALFGMAACVNFFLPKGKETVPAKLLLMVFPCWI